MSNQRFAVFDISSPNLLSCWNENIIVTAGWQEIVVFSVNLCRKKSGRQIRQVSQYKMRTTGLHRRTCWQPNEMVTKLTRRGCGEIRGEKEHACLLSLTGKIP
jgi:imidazole glycerol phosphate synthase subunit HisF